MKNLFIKKVMALLISFAIILTAQPIGVQAETVFEQGESYTLETIFEVPMGDEEGQLTIGNATIGDPGSEPMLDGGPSSFDIMPNGDILVVDTYNMPAPIKQYSATGEYIRTIPAEMFTDNEKGVKAVIVHQNKLYVYAGYSLFEYDLSTENIIKEFEVPEHMFLWGKGKVSVDNYILFIIGDTVVAFDTNNDSFLSGEKVKELFSMEYSADTNTVTIRLDENEFIIHTEIIEVNLFDHKYSPFILPLGTDKAGNLIVEFNGQINRKYTQSGELVALSYENYGGSYISLGDQIRVINGEVVRAQCDGETYKIVKIIMNEEFFTKQPLDLNFDNEENTGDAVLLLKYCADFEEFDPALVEKADINKDLKVNTGDAVAILLNIVS